MDSIHLPSVHVSVFSLAINGHKGSAILVKNVENPSIMTNARLYQKANSSDNKSSTTNTPDRSCEEIGPKFININAPEIAPLSLVGGKGRSLMKLANMGDLGKVKVGENYCPNKRIY